MLEVGIICRHMQVPLGRKGERIASPNPLRMSFDRSAMSTIPQLGNVTSSALLEAYCCSEDLCQFGVTPDQPKQAGFFRFGTDTICYGQCSGEQADSLEEAQYDAMEDVQVDGDVPVLLFNPDEVIHNLRGERYVAESLEAEKRLLHHAYYFVRPLLPVSFRRHLQRFRFRSSRDRSFPQWPVDCTVERIQESLLALSLKAKKRQCLPFVWFWPENYPACAIVTHDVETKAGLDACSSLMDLDDSFGIKSSFQLVPEKRYRVSDAILSMIQERGFEVNVHDLNHDGHLYSDRAEFMRRAREINRYARGFKAEGFRAGAMYRNPEWYGAFEFSYDMSVPNAGHFEAQAGGCCTVRPYFIGPLVELPLTTTQDYTLFHILGEYSIERWKQQIDLILRRNGLISFIVHPDYVIEKKAREVYVSLLRYLAQLREDGKLWLAKPGQVARWWRQRQETTLTQDGQILKIHGSGTERARVASACLDGNSVKYRVEN
jgi:hypothetical protein